ESVLLVTGVDPSRIDCPCFVVASPPTSAGSPRVPLWRSPARSSRSLPHPHERALPSPQRYHGRLRRFPRLPEKQTRIHPPYLPAASIIDDVKLPPKMQLQQALTLSPFLITLFGVAALNGTIV